MANRSVLGGKRPLAIIYHADIAIAGATSARRVQRPISDLLHAHSKPTIINQTAWTCRREAPKHAPRTSFRAQRGIPIANLYMKAGEGVLVVLLVGYDF